MLVSVLGRPAWRVDEPGGGVRWRRAAAPSLIQVEERGCEEHYALGQTHARLLGRGGHLWGGKRILRVLPGREATHLGLNPDAYHRRLHR